MSEETPQLKTPPKQLHLPRPQPRRSSGSGQPRPEDCTTLSPQQILDQQRELEALRSIGMLPNLAKAGDNELTEAREQNIRYDEPRR